MMKLTVPAPAFTSELMSFAGISFAGIIFPAAMIIVHIARLATVERISSAWCAETFSGPAFGIAQLATWVRNWAGL